MRTKSLSQTRHRTLEERANSYTLPWATAPKFYLAASLVGTRADACRPWSLAVHASPFVWTHFDHQTWHAPEFGGSTPHVAIRSDCKARASSVSGMKRACIEQPLRLDRVDPPPRSRKELRQSLPGKQCQSETSITVVLPLPFGPRMSVRGGVNVIACVSIRRVSKSRQGTRPHCTILPRTGQGSRCVEERSCAEHTTRRSKQRAKEPACSPAPVPDHNS